MLRSYFISKSERLKIDWGQKSRHFLTPGKLLNERSKCLSQCFKFSLSVLIVGVLLAIAVAHGLGIELKLQFGRKLGVFGHLTFDRK